MPAQNIITHRNLVKQPQSIAEGITVATYAVTPATPTFTNHGQDAALSDNSTPTVAVNRQAGKSDRNGTDKVSEENNVKLTMKVLSTDTAFLQFLTNTPNGAGTADESRTFVYSYLDEAGVETFIQYLGCKVTDCSMSYDTDSYFTLEATFSYKTKIEDSTGPLDTPVFGTPSTGTPLFHLDAGVEPFIYNASTLSIESFAISVTFTSASQKIQGSVTSQFMKPTQREISGSAVIYKKDETLQNNARDALEVSASYIIDSGNMVVTFTKFKFMPSGEELKGDDAEATKENKSWDATEMVIAAT